MKYSDQNEKNIQSNDVIDDFNKIKYCRRCGKHVEEKLPELCPHCHKPFESRADFIFRLLAYTLVIVVGIYLWQKVLFGLF